MKTIYRIFIYFIIGAFSWVVIFVHANEIKNQEDFFYKLKARFLGSCSVPLYYSLGSVDKRFGISENDFLEVVKQAENVWEESTQKNLFEYKEDSEFKINLVFDERQIGTIERKKLELKLQDIETSQKDIISEYNRLISGYDKEMAEYKKESEKYKKDVEKYRQNVDYWNKKGGAPEDEYEKIKEELEKLNQEKEKLEQKQASINNLVTKINSLVDKNQKMVSNYKKEVQTYKDRFGEAREFNQGLYVGEAINIYQFNDFSDLRLALAHELGHYLGIDHLSNPESVMHYLMEKQDLEDIKLTKEDLAAVENICR